MNSDITADLRRLHIQFDIDDPLFSPHFEVVLDHLVSECARVAVARIAPCAPHRP